MNELDTFLDSVLPQMEAADIAIHNGDAEPRRVLWSHEDPVTVFGAAFNSSGWPEVSAVFDLLAKRFSNCTSWKIDVHAAGVSGDLAYIAAFEHITASMDEGPATTYSLRVTTVFRRENGEWRIVHRHGDPVDAAAGALVAQMRSRA